MSSFLNGVIENVESLMSSVMSALRFHINDYCELETTWGNAFVAKDGSMATVVRYHGFQSLMSRVAFAAYCDELSNSLESFLNNRAHKIQVVFHREEDSSDEIRSAMQPSFETAERLQLDIDDLLDEKLRVMSTLCCAENVYLVLWTRKTVLDPIELEAGRADRVGVKRVGLQRAQNVYATEKGVVDRHEAFVDKVVREIQRLHGVAEVFEIHEAFTAIKRQLYPTTPKTWRPTLVGDAMHVRWKKNGNKADLSEFAHPRLDDQLFVGPAELGARGKGGEVTDRRAVRIGDRLFAPVMVKLPPKREARFGALFEAMNNQKSKNVDGIEKPMPWSISILLEGDGINGLGLKKMIAGVMGALHEDNRNFNAAVKSLTAYQKSSTDGGVVVKMQIMAMTWADLGQERQLAIRRQKLSRALAGWGDITVEEECGDPLAGFMSCVPAVIPSSIAPACAPPLHDALRLLPLSRRTSPFKRGHTLFRSEDGKILRWESFSDQQNTWLTLFFGGPGSGKSVQMNRSHVELCLSGGLDRLPYICVIDKGISSSGFISLIEEALPPHLKHLTLYKRIQNTAQYRVNPFDITLGNRLPLPRERETIKNQLVVLASTAERLYRDTNPGAHRFMDPFISRIIDEAFVRVSDQTANGMPKEFNPRTNDFIREKVVEHGIVYGEATKWWTIVDEFAKRGLWYEASVAQRYAVPTLVEAVAIGNELKNEFLSALDDGIPVFEEFSIMMRDAQQSYPVFNGVTEFDIGEARIMSLDLQDVLGKDSAAAKKRSALMVMMAINAFTKKISTCAEDLESINPAYRDYHARRVQELQEDLKRLAVDEYQFTGGQKQLQDNIMIFGRESRKWLMEVMLGSQLPDDFADMAKIATTTIILDSGNESTRGTIQKIFGLSPVEIETLKARVHGPQTGVGATFLAKIKTKTAEVSQVFTATSGGLELWSLSTTGEDRALRTRMYEAFGHAPARRVLAKEFPGGTCKSYVLNAKAQSRKSSSEGAFEGDENDSIIDGLFRDLCGKAEAMGIQRRAMEGAL